MMKLKQPPVSNATNAYDLLLDVRKAIKRVPKRLDMTVVCMRGVNAPSNAPACGTVGCLAGWSLVMKGHMEEDACNGSNTHEAAELLGLDSKQERALFWPDDLATAKVRQTARHAARTIAHLDRFMAEHEAQLKGKAV